MKFTLCKQQYIYLTLAMMSISLALTTHVFAQEPQVEPATPAGSMRDGEGRSEIMKERHEKIQEVQSSLLVERVQNRMINLSRNMEGRMQAAIGRIDQISERIDSRIEKLKSDNIDTTEAEMILGLSRKSLEAARTALRDIDATTVNGITSDRPRDAFKEIKERFIIARNSIKDSHTHLQTTLMILKEATADGDDLVIPSQTE